jgi:hypothetical protein
MLFSAIDGLPNPIQSICTSGLPSKHKIRLIVSDPAFHYVLDPTRTLLMLRCAVCKNKQCGERDFINQWRENVFARKDSTQGENQLVI